MEELQKVLLDFKVKKEKKLLEKLTPIQIEIYFADKECNISEEDVEELFSE